MQEFYDGTRNRVRYEIHGNNRGGRDHLQRLFDKVQASPEAQMPDIGLRDLRANPSEELARSFASQGVSVTVNPQWAPPESKAPRIKVLAIDDAEDVAREVDQPVTSQVLEVGIMVAAPTVEHLGGPVIALGTTVTPGAKKVSEQARPLFNTVADLAGERHSSKNMSDLILNSTQMKGARSGLHNRLTDSSLEYLKHGTVSPDIFAVDGLTRDVSPLAVIETRRDSRRQHLKDLATYEILPQAMEAEERAGVAFYDSKNPWLYMVFARRNGSNWRTANTVELPVKILQPIVIPVGDLVEERPRKSAATWSQTWVTD